MKLGIFDSGMGGKALAASLAQALPEADILVVDDHKNVPYGSKTTEQIISLTDTAIQPLLKEGCDAIIIACNTATMAAIETLRRTYPNEKFIGLEPMVKPAAEQTKTGIIAVCATPSTLASERYRWLVDSFAKDIKIIQPDCSNWARMIESGNIDKVAIKNSVDDCLEKGADIVILGCTHYHWIKDLITEIASDRATVLEPSEAIARRVRSVTSLSFNSTDSTPAPLRTLSKSQHHLQ